MIGAAIGLAIISLLVFDVNEPNPDWGIYWRVKPLILTPIIAGFGFLSFFLKEYIMPKSDAGKIIVFLISTIAFVISLWMGTVLGLNGTLWN
jgi:hypothetical protein